MTCRHTPTSRSGSALGGCVRPSAMSATVTPPAAARRPAAAPHACASLATTSSSACSGPATSGAFEAIYDRHHRGILAFCRHMLGSREEAEDAVQHTFVAAYRDLSGSRQADPAQGVALHDRPQPLPLDPARPPGASARSTTCPSPRSRASPSQVQRRQDLRDMLADLQRLPEDQRAALVLSELGALSHDEIAVTLGVRKDKVKALVFQARESLASSREARDADCREIQEQLAVLRGGSLRRTHAAPPRRGLPGVRRVQGRGPAPAQRDGGHPARSSRRSRSRRPSSARRRSAAAARRRRRRRRGVAGGGLLAAVGAKALAAKVVTIAVVAGGATGGGLMAVDEISQRRPTAAPRRRCRRLPEERAACRWSATLRERAQARRRQARAPIAAAVARAAPAPARPAAGGRAQPAGRHRPPSAGRAASARAAGRRERRRRRDGADRRRSPAAPRPRLRAPAPAAARPRRRRPRRAGAGVDATTSAAATAARTRKRRAKTDRSRADAQAIAAARGPSCPARPQGARAAPPSARARPRRGRRAATAASDDEARRRAPPQGRPTGPRRRAPARPRRADDDKRAERGDRRGRGDGHGARRRDARAPRRAAARQTAPGRRGRRRRGLAPTLSAADGRPIIRPDPGAVCPRRPAGDACHHGHAPCWPSCSPSPWRPGSPCSSSRRAARRRLRAAEGAVVELARSWSEDGTSRGRVCAAARLVAGARARVPRRADAPRRRAARHGRRRRARSSSATRRRSTPSARSLAPRRSVTGEPLHVADGATSSRRALRHAARAARVALGRTCARSSAAGASSACWRIGVARRARRARRPQEELVAALAAEAARAIERDAHVALLARQARTDELTALPNRRAWDEAVAARDGARRAHRRAAVPRAARPRPLQGLQRPSTATRPATSTCAAPRRAWRRELRTIDVLARYGGEEFGVLLPSCDIERGAGGHRPRARGDAERPVGVGRRRRLRRARVAPTRCSPAPTRRSTAPSTPGASTTVPA